jgi:hypothetical protein
MRFFVAFTLEIVMFPVHHPMHASICCEKWSFKYQWVSIESTSWVDN